MSLYILCAQAATTKEAKDDVAEGSHEDDMPGRADDSEGASPVTLDLAKSQKSDLLPGEGCIRRRRRLMR